MIALLPFLVLFLIMIVLKKPALWASLAMMITSIFIAVIIWQVNSAIWMPTFERALSNTLEIISILFGAILLYKILQHFHKLTIISFWLTKISDDLRVQVIMIAWFFASFIEGIAGFGVPAMIATPLLIKIGIKPILAISLVLIGSSVATTYGAVGTPIIVGIIEEITVDKLQIATQAGLLQLVIGSFVPLFFWLLMPEKGFSFKYLLAGFSLTIPMYIIARIFGPEFPAIGASIIGGLIFILSIKFYEKHTGVTNPSFPEKEHDAVLHQHLSDHGLDHNTIKSATSKKALLISFAPYIIVFLLLGLSRLNIFDLKSILTQLQWHNYYPFYSPGFFFVIASLFARKIFHLKYKILFQLTKNALTHSIHPFFTLFFILISINIMQLSVDNLSGSPSMLHSLVSIFSTNKDLFIISSSLIGAFGAFVVGSATVSNLLFGMVQYQTAISLNLPVVMILSLQVLGGAFGNMFALHNIIAASTVVSIENQETKIIKINALIACGVCLILGLIGWVVIKLAI